MSGSRTGLARIGWPVTGDRRPRGTVGRERRRPVIHRRVLLGRRGAGAVDLESARRDDDWSRLAIRCSPAWASAKSRLTCYSLARTLPRTGRRCASMGPRSSITTRQHGCCGVRTSSWAGLPEGTRTAVEKAVLPALRAWDRRVAHTHGQRPTRRPSWSGSPTPTAARRRSCTRRSRSSGGRLCHRREPEHFLWAGRLVAYKRPDIAVEAAPHLGGGAGDRRSGPERARLEPTAPPNVRFVGHVTEDELRDLMGAAHALVFPARRTSGSRRSRRWRRHPRCRVRRRRGSRLHRARCKRRALPRAGRRRLRQAMKRGAQGGVGHRAGAAKRRAVSPGAAPRRPARRDRPNRRVSRPRPGCGGPR